MFRLTKQRAIVLQAIARHPGIITASLDRAHRTAAKGHRWMYALVDRLILASMVRTGRPAADEARNGAGLYLTEQGQRLCRAAGMTLSSEYPCERDRLGLARLKLEARAGTTLG